MSSEVEMKIAVSVENPNLDAQVDPRFGKASYFVLVDSETMAWEALESRQNLGLPQGADIQAAWAVLNRSPEVVLTGNCGSKAYKVLEARGIRICLGVKDTAREAVQGYLDGRYKPAKGPNVERHWT